MSPQPSAGSISSPITRNPPQSAQSETHRFVPASSAEPAGKPFLRAVYKSFGFSCEVCLVLMVVSLPLYPFFNAVQRRGPAQATSRFWFYELCWRPFARLLIHYLVSFVTFVFWYPPYPYPVWRVRWQSPYSPWLDGIWFLWWPIIWSLPDCLMEWQS